MMSARWYLNDCVQVIVDNNFERGWDSSFSFVHLVENKQGNVNLNKTFINIYLLRITLLLLHNSEFLFSGI